MGIIDGLRNMLYGTQSVMQQQLMNGRSTFSGYDRNAIAALFYDRTKANYAVYSVINYCAEAIADTLRRAKIIDKKGNEVTGHWSYDVFLIRTNLASRKTFIMLMLLIDFFLVMLLSIC